MIVSKIPGIEAVAFDIDGTLYPAWKLMLHAVPFFIRHIRFMKAFGKVRRILHGYSSSDPDTALPDFFNLQKRYIRAGKKHFCVSGLILLQKKQLCG